MQQLAEFIRNNWRELKNAPGAFVLLALLSFGAGMLAQLWIDEGAMSAKDALLQAKDYQIGRYEVALGIKAPSQGIMVTLTNEELAAASTIQAGKLRALCFWHSDRNDEIDALEREGKLDATEAGKRWLKLEQSTSDKFDQTLRADTHIVDSELRRRLGKEAVASIVGVAPSVIGTNGEQINIVTLLPSGEGTSAAFLCVLADGIEQMAKLLPSG